MARMTNHNGGNDNGKAERLLEQFAERLARRGDTNPAESAAALAARGEALALEVGLPPS